VTASGANQPSVSIVLATYNRRELLPLAMDSVLDQTYPNLELLVMDDGSTDGTSEVLEEYARRHPSERYRFSRHENMGQANTLNRGYEMAHGEILGYLSDDDLLGPDAVARLVEVMVANADAVVAFPGYRMIDGTGEIVDTTRPIEYAPTEAFRLHDTIIGPGGLVRRAALEAAGGWDPSLYWMGDLILWMRIGLQGPVIRVPEPLASWRRHEGGITIETGLERAREHIRLVGMAEELLGLGDHDLALRAEGLRNACLTAAFFGGGPESWPGESFTMIDLQRPEISAVAAGLAADDVPDERADQTAALWRELARVIVELTELRSGSAAQDVAPGAGLASAARRLQDAGLMPGDDGSIRELKPATEVRTSLLRAAIDCGADCDLRASRTLLIDRADTPLGEQELNELVQNAFHSSVPSLRAAVERNSAALQSLRA
jgi:hypothetical protein